MLSAGKLIGKYKILGSIGAGGMGEVYRAQDDQLNREVAIKILPEAFSSDSQRLRRFEQEARSASALNHPNIVTIYEIGQHDFIPYIAMEYVDGKTLRELLSSGPMPVKKMLHCAVQIADALAKAHFAEIVHRDLKPENLMITKGGLVKLLDFGLAKLIQPAAEFVASAAPTVDVTREGFIVGTVGYMSPEQASGHEVDFRSDQFSLGVILYEMATGKRAFERPTMAESLSAIIREEPEPIALHNPGVPAPFRWIVERCLAKDQEERYVSTQDLARDLRTLQEHASETVPSGEIPARATRRIAAFWPAGGIAIVIIAIFAFILGWKAKIPPPIRERQLTFRRGYLNEARFAPDGRTVIYAASWAGKPVELFTTTTEGPESRTLGMKAGLFSISSNGELAIALHCRMNWGSCGGTLARVPLSGGAPREVMDGVDQADWGPDGKNIAVTRAAEGKYRVEFPMGHILYESPGWISTIRVSPRGDLIAFTEHPKLGPAAGSIAVVDLAGKRRVLSADWKAAMGLSWSPDGKTIWFSASRQGAGGSLSLHSVSLSGREREVYRAPSSVRLLDWSPNGQQMLASRITPRAALVMLSPGVTQERDLAWFDYSTLADLSDDGKTILFWEWGEGTAGTSVVYLRNNDGSDAVRLGDGKALALSPDKKWALVLQESRPPKLMLLPTGAGELKTLPIGAVNEIYWASWFRNGTNIMFAGSEAGHLPRTYVHNLQGNTTEAVTQEGMLGVLISPDGKSVAARYEADGNYYLIPVGGGQPEPISGLDESDVLSQWSADGRSLFVRGAEDFSVTLSRVDLATGKRQLWRQLSPIDPAGLIGIAADPRGVRLTPDGKYYAYTYWTAISELYLLEGLK